LLLDPKKPNILGSLINFFRSDESQYAVQERICFPRSFDSVIRWKVTQFENLEL